MRLPTQTGQREAEIPLSFFQSRGAVVLRPPIRCHRCVDGGGLPFLQLGCPPYSQAMTSEFIQNRDGAELMEFTLPDWAGLESARLVHNQIRRRRGRRGSILWAKHVDPSRSRREVDSRDTRPHPAARSQEHDASVSGFSDGRQSTCRTRQQKL